MKKTKKTGCFWLLCRVPGGGTRRTDQPFPCAAGSGTRRSMLPPGPPNQDFAVCHTVGTRQTSPLRRMPRARGTRRSRPRRRQLRPTPFIIFILPCAMNNTRRIFSPCARYMTHGEHPLRRASGCRRPPTAKFSTCAKWASPCAPGTLRNEEIR